jgi:hypothetical protein
MRSALLSLALAVAGCSPPVAAFVLPLDPTADHASEQPQSVARALAGQGWVPIRVEKGAVVTEWRDVHGFDDDDYPRTRFVVRLVATLEPERLVLRLESRALSASCAGVPHPPSDLTLVGCLRARHHGRRRGRDRPGAAALLIQPLD